MIVIGVPSCQVSTGSTARAVVVVLVIVIENPGEATDYEDEDEDDGDSRTAGAHLDRTTNLICWRICAVPRPALTN
jgi:hypothetical protein